MLKKVKIFYYNLNFNSLNKNKVRRQIKMKRKIVVQMLLQLCQFAALNCDVPTAEEDHNKKVTNRNSFTDKIGETEEG